MKLDVLIKGEAIDLCIPTNEFAKNHHWYSWFNDLSITRYLHHGQLPNTPDRQVNFLEKSRDNLVLLISDRRDYIGVVSLSQIDLVRRQAELGIVVNKDKTKTYSPLIPLEAVARIVQYGFDVLGLERVHAGQHVQLFRWGQRLELLGFRFEGVRRRAFVKGREVADVILISCLQNDFDTIIKKRKGKYWDSSKKMFQRIKKLPKITYFDRYMNFSNSVGDEYYKNILDL